MDFQGKQWEIFTHLVIQHQSNLLLMVNVFTQQNNRTFENSDLKTIRNLKSI